MWHWLNTQTFTFSHFDRCFLFRETYKWGTRYKAKARYKEVLPKDPYIIYLVHVSLLRVVKSIGSYKKSHRKKWLRSNWRLEQHTISVRLFHICIDLLSKYRSSHWPGVAERLQLLKDKNTFCSRASVFVQCLAHQKSMVTSTLLGRVVHFCVSLRVFV